MIRQTIRSFQARRKKIARQIASLESESGKLAAAIAALTGTAAAAKTAKKRRRMSKAARAKIASFQKARWAKIRAAKK